MVDLVTVLITAGVVIVEVVPPWERRMWMAWLVQRRDAVTRWLRWPTLGTASRLWTGW